MTNNEEQALKDFLLDIDCLKQLDDWTDNFNLFDVLKITNTEIRHSNILAWLFNPNENHGLGDSFIRAFMTKIAGKCEQGRYNIFNLLLQDFYSYQVNRESNHMDIVLFSREEKTAVIIENKIWAGESSHQLGNYLQKSEAEYKECNQILYAFLTPEGRDASDTENWIPFSYGEIIDLLESSTKGLALRDEVRLVIHNYVCSVRRNIMKEKDEKLISVCNDIYNKHRTALRLIYENATIDKSADSEIICGTLRELNSDGLIIYKNDNKWYFFTDAMDAYLPALNSTDSSWGTDWVYYYWFEKGNDTLVIHFEIGGQGLTDELVERSKALIKASNKKLDDYRYKRLYHKSVKLTQDNYEDSLVKAIKTLVKAALENERKLLSAVSCDEIAEKN